MPNLSMHLLGTVKMTQVLKEPEPIASDVFKTFWDFAIRWKLILFTLPQVSFTTEKMYRLADTNENMLYGKW